MSLTTTPDQTPTTSQPVAVAAESPVSGVPRSIAEFAGRVDFPKCAVGEFVDIGGFAESSLRS